MVKHKSKYSYDSMIYFNLDTETIKDRCKFRFYYNKTNITPTVLDGEDEIILANWLNDKHIVCNINNNILDKIPSHPYILVNRSVLFTCGIEVGNHFLLKSLAACENANSKLTVYFTVNTVFVNYKDKFPNLTETLDFPIVKDGTAFEQTSPISLNISKFDPTLMTASNDLREFITRYNNHKKILNCKKSMITWN